MKKLLFIFFTLISLVVKSQEDSKKTLNQVVVGGMLSSFKNLTPVSHDDNDYLKTGGVGFRVQAGYEFKRINRINPFLSYSAGVQMNTSLDMNYPLSLQIRIGQPYFVLNEFFIFTPYTGLSYDHYSDNNFSYLNRKYLLLGASVETNGDTFNWYLDFNKNNRYTNLILGVKINFIIIKNKKND